MSLITKLTFHFFRSKLGSSLVRSRMRRFVASFLTRRGRGFYPGFFRFLSDVSVPLADDKISNEKLVQFGQIFLRKSSTEMRIVVT